MNDEPAIVPELILNISDSSDQDVSVEAIGRDVLEFEASRQEKPPTSEMALPDPVLTLVAAAERGAFAHPLTEPWTSKIELLGKKVGLAEQKQFWMLRLRKIDVGAILVLANMLQARVLDRVTIQTVSPEGTEPSLPRLTSIAALTFPQIVPRPFHGRLRAGTPQPRTVRRNSLYARSRFLRRRGVLRPRTLVHDPDAWRLPSDWHALVSIRSGRRACPPARLADDPTGVPRPLPLR